MGLASLTLDAGLAANWCRILEEDGQTVCRDEAEEEKLRERAPMLRVTEVPWRVGNGKAELRVLQVARYERAVLVFMPTGTDAERKLFLQVWEALLAAGAVSGANPKGQGGRTSP